MIEQSLAERFELLMAEVSQLRAESAQLRGKVARLESQVPDQPVTLQGDNPKVASSHLPDELNGEQEAPQQKTSPFLGRRKLLGRLAGFMLAGVGAAALSGGEAQARVVTSNGNPGAIIVPSGTSVIGALRSGATLGLIASALTTLDLANFGNYNIGSYGGGSYAGVYGYATGQGAEAGVYGYTDADNASGVTGYATRQGAYQPPLPYIKGVSGNATNSNGDAYGVYGQATAQNGNAFGVYGTSDSSGVYGESTGILGYGVFGYTNASQGTAVFGLYEGPNGAAVSGKAFDSSSYAGSFQGRVYISGPLSKPGGSFKIDHPLEPENKYLYHSFVESPDMLNIYNGNVALDAKGEATVEMPNWFEALNSDFRYQLTSIGGACPNLHIAQEIKDLKFRIAGGTAGQKVSWQVTGVRQDKWAKANRIPVEEEKKPQEKGKYLHPTLFGKPESQAIGIHPTPAKS